MISWQPLERPSVILLPSSFGKRSAAFEQQARSTFGEFMEKRIQCPANPKVFFEVAFVGSKPPRRRDKEVAPVFG
jgi:hypothetical protein